MRTLLFIKRGIGAGGWRNLRPLDKIQLAPPPRSPDKRRKGKEGAGKNDLRGGGGFILRWGINFQGNSIFPCIHLITVTIFQLHFKLKVIFLTWVSLHAKPNTHYEGWKYKKKKKKKTRPQESYLQRAQRKNVSTNSRLKAIQIQIKGKHSTDKEFRNLFVPGTYQNNEWTYHENEEVEPFQPIQMNIYQSNIYRKDLSWLHFDDEPREK